MEQELRAPVLEEHQGSVPRNYIIVHNHSLAFPGCTYRRRGKQTTNPMHTHRTNLKVTTVKLNTVHLSLFHIS